ncbi:MAG: hypothetical protein O3C40_10630 [Planctomycetota bacterium]|nr:hypothetical protein [Planctomycetota bacterium]
MPELTNDVQLTGQLVRVTEIDARRRDEMYALMDTYYENMDRSTFNADLNEKEWVIQIVDKASNELKGFSSQVLIQSFVDGRSIRALFSGDTIVESDRRGQQKLFQVSGWFLRRLMDAYPDDEMYWFLISKGYKTYRFLPLFFREFYPRFSQTAPPRYKAIIDSLARHIDPSRYDPRTGILRAGRAGCRLRPGVADITADRLRDQHVQFFADANPQHARGDELCGLAPLTPTNFTRAAYRAMGPEPPAELVLS